MGKWQKPKKRRGPPKPPGPPRPYPYQAGKCPACGAEVVFQQTPDGITTLCEPQRRLVIFEYEPHEIVYPNNPLIVFGERTGRLVIGRAATKEEKKKFATNGMPGKPFTVGRFGHLQNCTRWDRWLSGEISVD